MGDLLEIFHICHSNDQPLCDQLKHEATEKRKQKEASGEKDASDKKSATVGCNNSSSTDHDISSNCYPMKTCVTHVTHARAMGMMCCGNPALVIAGTIQTIASPWTLPPIALKTEPSIMWM